MVPLGYGIYCGHLAMETLRSKQQVQAFSAGLHIVRVGLLTMQMTAIPSQSSQLSASINLQCHAHRPALGSLSIV